MTRMKVAYPGVELPPIQFPNSRQQHTSSSDVSSSVGRNPSPLPRVHSSWSEGRSMTLQSRPRSETEKIELPSIGQAVPEIHTRVGRPDQHYRTDSVSRSPTFEPRGALPLSGYGDTPSQKRRRTSIEDEQEPRAVHHQRSISPLRSGSRPYSSTVSPSSSTRRGSIQSITDSRSASNRASPYVPSRGLPSIRSPRLDPSRITLPSINTSTLDRTQERTSGPPLRAERPFGDFSFDSSRSGAHTYPQATTAFDAPPSFANGYQPRVHSFSGPSGRGQTPFSNTHSYSNSNNYAYNIELGDSGSESKQRKRRGNLPKEVTDKLRAWFQAHVQHPYPTEDEKQDLMRQTGLQMNQISNWFINARRRHLPTMINNARAESNARSARGVEASGHEGGNLSYGNRRERANGTMGDSDDGGSSFGEEYPEPLARRDQDRR